MRSFIVLTKCYSVLYLRPLLSGRLPTRAGKLAAQRRRPTAAGTLSGDSATFGVLVLGMIILVGARCFLPALALGPIAEQLQH